MVPLKPTYVNDAQGKPVAVVLDIRSYEQLLEELEDLEDVRDGKAILAAIAAGEEEVMTLEQATTALESDWAAPEQGSTPRE